jgi:hypothetical protein
MQTAKPSGTPVLDRRHTCKSNSPNRPQLCGKIKCSVNKFNHFNQSHISYSTHTPDNRSYRQSPVVEKSCPPISFDLKSLHTPLLPTALNGGNVGVEQRESRTERRSRLGSANWRRSVSGTASMHMCEWTCAGNAGDTNAMRCLRRYTPVDIDVPTILTSTPRTTPIATLLQHNTLSRSNPCLHS